MEVNIDSIVVGGRKRQLDMEKVATLAGSIHEIGLLNPITIRSVNNHYELVAGAHRLEACRLLQLTTIRAELFEGDDLGAELAEIDENLRRNDLTVLEQGEHLLRRNEILSIRDVRAKVGQGRPKNGETVSPFLTTTQLAAELGMSERSAQQRTQAARDILPAVKDAIRDTPIADSTTQLLQLARMQPEAQQKIADAIKQADGEITVTKAMREVVKAQVKEAPDFPSGKYRVIYADPPWSYGNTMPDYYGVQDDHYPTMTMEEICGLPVEDLAEDNAVLFLWVTSPILEESFQVVNAWGFKYKATFIWDKIAHVMGHYNSVRHEILLVCVRGSCQPDVLKLFDSVVSEERTEHSRKPETFRTIIDTIYPFGRRVELFARGNANGWDAFGNERTLS